MPNNQNIPNSNSSSTSYRVEEEFVSGAGKSPRTNTADTNADTVAPFETILDNIESETALEDAMGSEGINDAVLVPIREEIVALNSWCTAPYGSGCQRCVAACPHQAISLTNDGPYIDSEKCTYCGICAGICDAFAWSRITLGDLAARCEREAKSEGFVCFTCNEHIFEGLAPRSNVIILPCLASVPPEFWSYLLAKNIQVELFLDETYCQDCQAAGEIAPMLFRHAIDQAQSWTGRSMQRAKLIPERESVLSMYANVDEGSRRDLLAVLANEGLDIATGKHRQRNAGTLDAFHENQERLRAQGRIKSAQQTKNIPTAFRQSPEWPRQHLIVQAARALPERAALLERYATITNYSACEQSHTCVNACPTGARRISEQGYPIVDVTRCNACGICCAVCPQHACDFVAITAHEYCERTIHDKEDA